MADQQASPSGPDLAQGVALSEFTGETLLGHVGDQDVLLVRTGTDIFAIDAHCSHYHGPLADGLVVGDSIRCPWHHACFDLRSGEATRAPALNALGVWQVEREGDRIFVRQKREQRKPYDTAALAAEIERNIDDNVRRQAAAGVDIGNDGETPRVGFSTYTTERMTCFGGESRRKRASPGAHRENRLPSKKLGIRRGRGATFG